MRTTLDIDDPILAELKQVAARRELSMARVANELLMQALAAQRRSDPVRPHSWSWQSAPMEARVDLEDKEALSAALDEGS